jgi:predicted Zn-dependent protease
MGRTYIELGDYAKAVSLLEPLVERTPGYTTAYYALGEAFGRQKKMGEAHYYLGLFYWNRKDTKNAVFHLKRASELISDDKKQEKIKNMLKRFQKDAPESDTTQRGTG